VRGLGPLLPPYISTLVILYHETFKAESNFCDFAAKDFYTELIVQFDSRIW